MDNMNNVSATAIDKAIEYIQKDFTEPLIRTGENILDNYEKVSGALQSESITRSIRAQRFRIDELKRDLEAIFTKARQSAEESNDTIKKNQANIDDSMLD